MEDRYKEALKELRQWCEKWGFDYEYFETFCIGEFRLQSKIKELDEALSRVDSIERAGRREGIAVNLKEEERPHEY